MSDEPIKLLDELVDFPLFARIPNQRERDWYGLGIPQQALRPAAEHPNTAEVKNSDDWAAAGDSE